MIQTCCWYPWTKEMADFGDRLTKFMEQGNLTAADLATLLQTSDSTLRGWLNDHRYPRLTPHDRDALFKRIHRLEDLLKSKKGLPIPRCPMQERQRRIRELMVA